MKTSHLILFVLLQFLLQDAKAQTKVINVSQQGPDTRLLLNNYKGWEAELPFDGLSICFNPNNVNTSASTGYYGRTENELCHAVFKNSRVVDYNSYTNAVNDLKQCRFQKFRNNFLFLYMFEDNWSQWESDDAWQKMMRNLSNAARIAKQSGLKGIILDTEHYGSPQNLDLPFYCMQFTEKTYVKDGKQAYVNIKEVTDAGGLDDLFPKPATKILWKDKNDMIGNVRLSKAINNVYKDNAGNYYYPLLDPKFKADIQRIISSVEKRGQQIIQAIKGSFPDAEIILTCGPSYTYSDLQHFNGLNASKNYLRTNNGLIVNLVKGMLDGLDNSAIKLFDGQEQTYYYKTAGEFKKADGDFNAAAKYFSGAYRNKYLSKMNRAFAIYPRPSNGGDCSQTRFFCADQLIAALSNAKKEKSAKYIWVWEEKQSFWYKDALQNKYIQSKAQMTKIGGANFQSVISNMKKGIQSK